MSRVLLVDTNRAAVPIYEALCDEDHAVTVVGGRPFDPLAKLARDFVHLDYSDASELDELISRRKIEYLVPGCTDLSYSVCAQINNGRFPGFDSPDNARTINDKKLFRGIASKLALSSPRVLSSDQAAQVASVIVKPVDSFSGKGVTRLERPNRDDIDRALETASQVSACGEAIIEEFVSGQLFSHSAFLDGGKIVADFVVREDQNVSPFAVDSSHVVASPQTQLRGKLREETTRLASSLNLVDGLIHTQFILSNGQFWIIEITRRCPGDLYSLLVEFSTGYSYAKNYAAPFLGKACSAVSKEKYEPIIRHTISSPDPVSFMGIEFFRPIDIRLFVPLLSAGDELATSPHGRAGIVFFRTESIEAQRALYRSILDGSLYSLR